MASSRVHPEDLEIGDHVYVRRRWMAYSHHGVYVGEGRVIHYSDAEGLARKSAARIVETPMEEFLAGGTLRRRNHRDRLPPEEAVERARALLAEQSYSLVGNNCEHFASWCVTGRSESRQVQRAASVAAAAVMIVGSLATRGGRRRS